MPDCAVSPGHEVGAMRWRWPQVSLQATVQASLASLEGMRSALQVPRNGGGCSGDGGCLDREIESLKALIGMKSLSVETVSVISVPLVC